MGVEIFGATEIRFDHHEMFLQSGFPVFSVESEEGEILLATKGIEWDEKDLILGGNQESSRVRRFCSKEDALVGGVVQLEFALGGVTIEPKHLLVMVGPVFLKQVVDFDPGLMDLFSGWEFIQRGFRITTKTLEEYGSLVEGLADAAERSPNQSLSGQLLRKGLLALSFFRSTPNGGYRSSGRSPGAIPTDPYR